MPSGLSRKSLSGLSRLRAIGNSKLAGDLNGNPETKFGVQATNSRQAFSQSEVTGCPFGQQGMPSDNSPMTVDGAATRLVASLTGPSTIAKAAIATTNQRCAAEYFISVLSHSRQHRRSSLYGCHWYNLLRFEIGVIHEECINRLFGSCTDDNKRRMDVSRMLPEGIIGMFVFGILVKAYEVSTVLEN